MVHTFLILSVNLVSYHHRAFSMCVAHSQTIQPSGHSIWFFEKKRFTLWRQRCRLPFKKESKKKKQNKRKQTDKETMSLLHLRQPGIGLLNDSLIRSYGHEFIAAWKKKQWFIQTNFTCLFRTLFTWHSPFTDQFDSLESLILSDWPCASLRQKLGKYFRGIFFFFYYCSTNARTKSHLK